MSASRPAAAAYQRNALAPSILAALILFTAPALITGDWFIVVRYAVSILALIVGYFGVQARQWWWAPVFVAIAVLWNPVIPITLPVELAAVWVGAQLVAAVVFLIAGTVIRTERAPEPKAR